MNKKYQVALFILICLGVVMFLVVLSLKGNIAVIHAKGSIGVKQRDLLILSTGLMLLIVVPVVIISIAIAWNYRKENTKAKYDPEWNESVLAECVWWGLPCVIIIILSVITWKACYDLDPFKPLASEKKPLTIQVVALDWKWLFIYPEEKIASVNFFQFPEGTPLNFEITADAPMNSFWIPALGGQIFAMPGMITKLHLIANETGSFRGVSANISGKGFSGMVFTAKSSSQEEFNQWVQKAQKSQSLMTLQEYQKLAKPSENTPVKYYALKEGNLFHWILMKFMMPQESQKQMSM
jgi:cytochrome o ubiquinol oxidase subunit 2